ncbi:hypothetical protein PTKIN_Ptkin01aG0136100 [Pterospermum kingtungense]
MDWTRGRTIGRGSAATVSIATAGQSRHVFAVKSSELSQSESLRREQRILSTLSCPQVVAYKGCDTSSENGKLLYNLFMEYAPGGTIMDAIHKHGGCLDETMVRSYARGILLGLQFLHSSGIVHCDIKGRNILVTADGVKIADLGCARRADDALSVAGTPVYMAPEVARGEQQGFPADIWALGCTVIEMVTGRGPWPDVEDPVSALYRIGFSCDVPETPNNISKQAMDFLSRCLRRDPVERWSAAQLLSHDFLKESKKRDGCVLDTPNSILDRHLWDSMEELQTMQIPPKTSKSLKERIQRLADDINLVSSLKMPNWESNENWVTVRSNCKFEVEILPIHENEPTTTSWGGDISRMSDDHNSLVYYYLTKIGVKNTSSNSAECKPSSLTECKNMTSIIFIKLNFSIGKSSAIGKRKF